MINIVCAFVFRVEIIGFLLTILRKATRQLVWINDFEKLLKIPLSWAMFFLLVWSSLTLLDLNVEIVETLLILLLGMPLLWSIHRLFRFLTILIVRAKGWEKSTSMDDYSRVTIVTEGINLVNYLVLTVVFSIIYLERLQIDSKSLITVGVLSFEVMIVLGSYTWVKNIMGGLVLLKEEPITIGSYARVSGQEGVVEAIYLRSFVLCRPDKGRAYIPNAVLLDTMVDVLDPKLKWKITVACHFDPQHTSSDQMREFLQQTDQVLAEHVELRHQSGGNISRTLTKPINLPQETARGRKNHHEHSARMLNHSSSVAGIAENQPESHQYWVSLKGLYAVDIVYYTAETDHSSYSFEKSQLILRIMQLIETLKLELYEEVGPGTDEEKLLDTEEDARINHRMKLGQDTDDEEKKSGPGHITTTEVQSRSRRAGASALRQRFQNRS